MILQLARSLELDLFLGDDCLNAATSGMRLDLSGPVLIGLVVWDSLDLPGAEQVQLE